MVDMKFIQDKIKEYRLGIIILLILIIGQIYGLKAELLVTIVVALCLLTNHKYYLYSYKDSKR